MIFFALLFVWTFPSLPDPSVWIEPLPIHRGTLRSRALPQWMIIDSWSNRDSKEALTKIGADPV
jgi:hypothetical protein